MTSLIEFTVFSALPVELRFKIWESVPQPQRVIGQLPCSKCWKFIQAPGNRNSPRTGCPKHLNHPDWLLRYVANKNDEAIFPPLHACRESRAIWLPRYYSPPRHIELTMDHTEYRADLPQDVPRLRFDIPFISYETDMFAIYDMGIAYLNTVVDPFLGLDRQRIRRIAISENAWSLVESVVVSKIASMPELQSISILVAGPDPDIDGVAASGWLEMHAVDVQHVDCDFRFLPDETVYTHPLFSSESRLRHLIFSPESKMRTVYNYQLLFKSWLWHGINWDDQQPRDQNMAPWWEFKNYVFDEDEDVCPLPQNFCAGSHTKEEMMAGCGDLDVDFLFLVEKGCLAELTSSSVLEPDPTGNYEPFFEYKARKLADFEQRSAV